MNCFSGEVKCIDTGKNTVVYFDACQTEIVLSVCEFKSPGAGVLMSYTVSVCFPY